MIRPQTKRQKQKEEMRATLKKGDKVVTAGGLHGKVVSVEGDVVTLDVDRGTKIKFDKNSISFEMTSSKK